MAGHDIDTKPTWALTSLTDKKWSECIDALHDLENLCQPDASSAAPPLPVGSSSTDRPDNISSAAPPLLSVGNSSADMNSTTSGMIDPKTRMQMLAVANIHLFSQRGDWNAVLRLRPPDSSDLNPRDVHVFPAAEVRRQYRRMAALVHPDKCGLPHTTEAFDLLARAQDELLGISCRGKKRKHDANREGDESDHFSETFTPDEGFEWWGEWDIPPSSAARRSTCVGGEPHPRAPSHADAEDQAFLRGLTLEVGGLGLSMGSEPRGILTVWNLEWITSDGVTSDHYCKGLWSPQLLASTMGSMDALPDGVTSDHSMIISHIDFRS